MNDRRKLQTIEELHAVSRQDESHFFKKLEALKGNQSPLRLGFFGKIFRKQVFSKQS
jgi:hypothetical protein